MIHLAENLGAPHFCDLLHSQITMTSKVLLCLATICYILTFIFIALSKMITNHRWLTECVTDQDCVGDASMCESGHCHCDVYYFNRVWRCDVNAPRQSEPFAIIALVLLVSSIGLGCAASIDYDKNHD